MICVLGRNSFASLNREMLGASRISGQIQQIKVPVIQFVFAHESLASAKFPGEIRLKNAKVRGFGAAGPAGTLVFLPFWFAFMEQNHIDPPVS